MLLFLSFLYGSIFGSFLNVVSLRTIARLHGHPAGSILTTRSACPDCHSTLRWWELIPIFSFLFLRGRCARCHARISFQYPVVEITFGVITAMLWLLVPTPHTGTSLLIFTLQLIIAGLLLVLFIIDLKTMLLPDKFIVMLSCAVLTLLATQYQLNLNAVIGLLIGAGFLFLLWAVTRGRGLGFGDVKLMLPLGALFGGWGTVVLLFIAFIIGGLISIILLLRGHAHLKTAIPFGPFLVTAALLLLLFPDLPAILLPVFLPLGYM